MADVLLIIGTSLNVYPAAGLVHYVSAGTPIYLIDPNQVAVPGLEGLHVIQKKAGEGMKDFINEIKKHA
jgi:NAD-dependent deacetylase